MPCHGSCYVDDLVVIAESEEVLVKNVIDEERSGG